MRFGFWMPVFGGWLRNVEDERMAATFAYQRELAERAEATGWDVTLIAELNLNDIKGPEADCLEAWTTAAALAPLTKRLRFLVAVRPGLQSPSVAARMTATLDRVSNGRLLVNVVTGGDPVENKGDGIFLAHDERYAVTREFLSVYTDLLSGKTVNFEGRHLRIEEGRLLR